MPLTLSRLAESYNGVRSMSESLCAPLVTEDYVIQTMPDVSPTKWHLAHTTWFFETFLLKPFKKNYTEYHPAYNYIFNSYYNAVGERHCRVKRGQLSRPSVDEIYRYRQAIDESMMELLNGHPISRELEDLITLGLHHEQQHQELMLTDIKHVFACSPLHPTYNITLTPEQPAPPPSIEYLPYESGLYTIGHNGEAFGYDNETPRHEHFLQPFGLASRLTTNSEYIHFIEDGGYTRPELWLADGWAMIHKEQWQAPYYWENVAGTWHHFTLNGFIPVNPHAPVCHVSFYEADAYARWAGKRLPTEQEWEIAAQTQSITGNFLEQGHYTPIPHSKDTNGLQQMYGDVWEWTASPYTAYPGYRTPQGAIGEYNGKFMSNQMVLRGGSCVTPRSHIRPTYRNFFYPCQRWQFMGFRLAEDL